ncbi:LysM peptidoglycan-binding domain-containing protein [Anaerolineales bacterium HSG6]|nr:LysM peptidoglycan-binding domain-containing protein [Anaerolineales bacterium HSG6]
MGYKVIRFLLFSLMFLGLSGTIVYAQQGGWVYTVQPQDTLISVATRYNVDVNQLAAHNHLQWHSRLLIGQRLVIPGSVTTAPNYSRQNSVGRPGVLNPVPTNEQRIHVVKTGDTLTNLAARYNVSIEVLQRANNLVNAGFIYNGQQLIIPSRALPARSAPTTNTAPQPEPAPQQLAIPQPATSPIETAARWIYVDLSDQQVTAYQGGYPIYTTKASTGLPHTPTVVGDFNVYVKHEATRMQGGYGADSYDLANVPHTMYFYQGYALHGAYWHNNFGTPMSHGCVNLSLPDAKWFYNFATVGTKVVVRQ